MTTTMRPILILVGFGLLAAVMAGPQLAPARYQASDYASEPLPQQIGQQAASPDLLAYLAFLNAQERIRADAHERWTIEDRRAAMERYRLSADRQAWQAGMASYEAESLRRRADFSIAESKIRNEADARIRNVESELAELRRAAEEDTRRLAAEELAAELEAHSAHWDDAEARANAAMAIQAATDHANVEESRNLVRASYAPDPTREARWIRASAWSAAEREVKERTTKVRLAKDREASEATFKVAATRQARAKLHSQLTELPRRDAAVLATMRREYEAGYRERQSILESLERAERAEVVAQIEQASAKRAEEWARFEESGTREGILTSAGTSGWRFVGL